MRITITCPVCNRRSQIEAKYQGKRLRCPYPDCRRPFRVGENGEALPLEEAAIEQGPKEASWQAAPPPARVTDWRSEAPPVQNGDEAQAPSYEAPTEQPYVQESSGVYYGAAVSTVDAGVGYGYDYRPHKGKRSRKIMLAIIGIFILLCGLVGWYIFNNLRANEGKLAKIGEKHWLDENYPQAIKTYEELIKKFPRSNDLEDYNFFLDYSKLRDETTRSSFDIGKVNTGARDFYKKFKDKQTYRKNRFPFFKDTVKISDAALDDAMKKGDPKILEFADECVKFSNDIGESINQEAATARAEAARLNGKLTQARVAVDTKSARTALVADFKSINEKKEPGSIETAQSMHANAVKRFPDLAKDAEINGMLDSFRANEASWVVYSETPAQLPRGPVAEGSEGTSLIIAPLVDGTVGPSPEKDRVGLVLVNGILYGLSETTGDVRWMVRVGIDTNTLPLRIPRASRSDLALVLSTETDTLTAVDAQTGKAEWHFRMDKGDSCPAGPILVGQRAYVPSLKGKVYVLDITNGRILGRFDVGQPLTVPGAFDSLTQRLYLPAEFKRMYVLDIENNKCAGVIYTNHTTGALRTAPIVSETALILCYATGLEEMRVRAFKVPADVTKAEPYPDMIFDVPGWSWFKPTFDGDTLGMVTDRGSLALFGFNRKTLDKQIFPLAKPLPIGEQRGLGPTSQLGRAQVAYTDLNQWWLLLGGRLYRQRFDLYRQQLVNVPTDPHPLGTPLHDSQTIHRGNAMLLVTQALDQPRAVATAIDGRTGKIMWQRQLGFLCSGTPVTLGQHVLAVDPMGGLFHVDGSKLTIKSDADFVTAGNWLAEGIDGAPTPKLVASADGTSAASIVHVPATGKVMLRRFAVGDDKAGSQVYPLETTPLPNGTPALCKDSIVVPCRDGNLHEFPVSGSAMLPLPLTWRDRAAPIQAAGHAAFVSDNQLLATDGARKILQWERSGGGGAWRKVDRTIEFTGRLATPIAVLKGTDGLLAVGDEGGTLYIASAKSGEIVRSWSNQGKITKGPFQRNGRIGIVLDDRRLLSFDPSADKPVWEKSFTQGIAGEPQLVGKYILVSESAGSYTWLDADKGTPIGEPHRLKTHVVPAAPAVALGADTALAPLSDGTMLLLKVPATP